jgi:hypothetical protein
VNSAWILADDNTEDYEEEEKKTEAGVLDIITGAFLGDINKVIGGAFSFTPENVQEAIVPSLTGQTVKPKTVNPKETDNKATDEDEDNSSDNS